MRGKAEKQVTDHKKTFLAWNALELDEEAQHHEQVMLLGLYDCIRLNWLLIVRYSRARGSNLARFASFDCPAAQRNFSADAGQCLWNVSRLHAVGIGY